MDSYQFCVGFMNANSGAKDEYRDQNNGQSDENK